MKAMVLNALCSLEEDHTSTGTDGVASPCHRRKKRWGENVLKKDCHLDVRYLQNSAG